MDERVPLTAREGERVVEGVRAFYGEAIGIEHLCDRGSKLEDRR
jgi:hypothetical protein